MFFKPAAVQTVLAERRGECLQFAKCCRLLFQCPFVSAENLCLIYKPALRPKSCVHFPLNCADLEDVKTSTGPVYGYHFISRSNTKAEEWKITGWKTQSLDHVPYVSSTDHQDNQGPDVKELHAKIGQLSMENDFL